MKVKAINIDGNKSVDIELSDKIFSLKPNKSIIQTIIYWQQNHAKPRTAKTKQRGEIKGSTAIKITTLVSLRNMRTTYEYEP